MNNKTRFNEQVADIVRRANVMRQLCIQSQFDSSSRFIEDEAVRAANINPCEIDPMFESVSDMQARQIVSACQSAVREYSQQYGTEPRDEVLASAHKTMESMLTLEGERNSQSGMMLESIGKSLETSEGVDLRAKMVALILPTLLATATSDAVTFIPARNDRLEFFRMRRIAGSSFGDYKRGDLIDDLSAGGQYAQMRQIFPMVAEQQPNGTLKKHVFTSATDLVNTKKALPMKKGAVAVFVNHKKVASDFDTNGNIFGTDGGVTYTGTCDYENGVITVNTSVALEAGIEMHVQFDVNIEQDPSLIPTIQHELESRVITPFEGAIAAEATIQAMFALQREYGIDLKSTQMQHMRNLLAAEKAARHLRDMNFACTRVTTFNKHCPAGYDWKLQRELLHDTLLKVSQLLLSTNKVAGLTGLFAGVDASILIKSLGAPFFVPAPNYTHTNHVHFTGTLFGVYKVFEAPEQLLARDEMLCYARGRNHTEAGYIAGDAVAPTMYDHEIGATLRSRETLWELSFAEVNPFNGADYFYRVKVVDEAPVESADCPPCPPVDGGNGGEGEVKKAKKLA